MITHRAIVAACAGAHVLLREANIEITERDRMLSFLTLAHVYDRVMEEFVLSVGATIGYWQGDVKKIMDDCQALKPTLFIAVPRVLERVADAVEGKLAKGPAAARVAFGAVYHLKLALERRGVPSLYAGLGLDHVIFRKVRAAMGGRVRYIISGGAPLVSLPA
jgi:long-chain acyl-CoA synthetase